MSVSGIEAIGGALAAMPATPTADYLSDAQAAAAGGAGAANGASFDALLNAAGGSTPTDAVQATDTGSQAIAASQAQGLAASAPSAGSGSGAEFGSLLSQGVDRLEGLQNTSSNLSVQAATGDLNAIHDYTIAAAEASTATQLTVSLKNAAVQSFQSIMNMQV
ncbi:MAG: flagellar hook-basal body complex protein FliE [Nocardioides sp.]